MYSALVLTSVDRSKSGCRVSLSYPYPIKGGFYLKFSHLIFNFPPSFESSNRSLGSTFIFRNSSTLSRSSPIISFFSAVYSSKPLKSKEIFTTAILVGSIALILNLSSSITMTNLFHSSQRF